VITDVPGIRVGHWTDADARTGCTVVLPPPGAVASGEIRGGAPAERDFVLLAPERTVQHVDAVVLTGGSVYGLATCDGVLRWCGERGIGLATPAGRVPVVVGMALFDLPVAAAGVRPTADAGYAACDAAVNGRFDTGPVGAAAGATVGTWRGLDRRRPGALGSASERHGEVIVGAIVAVNAFGEPFGAGERPPFEPALQAWPGADDPDAGALQNTTLAVVATNARLDKVGCLLAAGGAHDGYARAIEPSHTTLDGDAVVALATGEVDTAVDVVRALAARAVEGAVRQAFATT
jgi:L-aminopeptidase/D-esterase-like protein